jgi:hypothetical protein
MDITDTSPTRSALSHLAGMKVDDLQRLMLQLQFEMRLVRSALQAQNRTLETERIPDGNGSV